jgi:hypothetical protein
MKEQSKPINVGAHPHDQNLTTSVKVRSRPASEQIRQRAYETLLAHGGTPGAVYKALRGDWGVEFPHRVE